MYLGYIFDFIMGVFGINVLMVNEKYGEFFARKSVENSQQIFQKLGLAFQFNIG